MRPKRRLGVYLDFPSIYNASMLLEINAPVDEAQRALLNFLHNINGRGVGGRLLNHVGQNVSVMLEFGVAEGLAFNYINDEILNILLGEINERIFQILDFFCVIRYYALKNNGAYRALRFDYYFLRFIFSRSELEVKVSHERGLGRISAEDLLKFILEGLSSEMAKKGFNMLKIKRLWLP